MTTSDIGRGHEAGPPTADDLRRVSFTQASMLHPGYTDREVDEFVARVADELARLTDENARLRGHVQQLQHQLEEASARPSPSDQAVGILATAQLTADEYVAEAEDFSRQMTSEARAQYEEQLTEARERAGAIVQAAAEARAAIVASGGGAAGGAPGTQELQQQLAEASARPSPSDQAVGILATAQLTADEYVAEAEDFSRQMTSEARAQYEEQLSQARERAGAIIQAATEARAAITAAGGARGDDAPGTQELQEQIAYLRAFGQATRVQLRSYLEALLRDVETEWGRAHPAVLSPALLDQRDQQLEAGGGTAASFHDNAATVPATGDAPAAVPATRSAS